MSFDPSGHICATLIALVLLIQKCEDNLDRIVFAIVESNAIISLFYTAYVFHSIPESIIGFFSAILICEMCNILKLPVVRVILND